MWYVLFISQWHSVSQQRPHFYRKLNNKELCYSSATHYLIRNRINCCATVQKVSFVKDCNRWKFSKVTQGHRNCRYSIGQISLFINGLYSITVTLFYTFWGILPLFQCTWLPVTLRSPSVLIRHLKVQAMCAFRFIYKYVVVIVHAVFSLMWDLEKF